MQATQAQIFGTRKCKDSRKAERFFKERRIRIHYVDLTQRAASKGELRRFAQRFGVEALIDRDSARFKGLGLGPASYGEDRWLEILSEEPLILRTPLVRFGNRLSVGLDEAEWKEWAAAEGGR
jgi:arsenate reductase-like glutaredoxin family protein